MDNRLKTAGLLCFTLIFALVGPMALAQEEFLPAPIPPSGGYTGNYQYANPAPQQTTSSYTTPQYQTSQPQYQAPQYQTAQSATAPYTATQQQTTPYQTAQPYYQNPQAPVAPYPSAVQQPGNYAQNIPASPAMTGTSNQVEQTRYIQPSMPTLQPSSQATMSNAAGLPPYTPPTANYADPTTNENTASSKSIEGQTVVDVRILGNLHVSKAEIASMIHTRKGREYKNELVQRDVRELSRSGKFVNVKPSYQETPEGPIVIFEVLERPMLDSIMFVGAKEIKHKVLLKESGLAVGDMADPFKVEEARRTLEYFYHDKGFAQAIVTIKKGNKPGDRDAIFIINEGSKQKILWTKFEGNSVASDARLRTQIESKQGIFWFINGEFNREKIEADKEKLTAYYRGLGYFKAKVGAETTFPFDNWATITFVIDEGPRYTVRETRFIGNEIYREGQLQEDLKLLSGEYFNQNKMNSDIRAIQERYGRVGYVFADIKAEPRFLEEPGQLDLVYKVKEGDQYVVGDVIIKIKGEGETSRTQRSVVLNRLSFGPGDIIDTQKIRESETRIRASQVFSTNAAGGGQPPKILISPPDDLEESHEVGSHDTTQRF